MKNLDLEALREACRTVAKATLWQTPEVRDISDIIDSDQIERTVEAYYVAAELRANELAEDGHDPNFVTRAVLYLAHEHAIPPMKEDTRWFQEALDILVRLISPITVPDGGMTAFMRDIERAARRYRREVESTANE